MNKQILLINPFSSAKYLSDRFQEYGIFTTALYTIDLSKVSSYILPKNDLFNEQINIQSQDLKKIIKELGVRQFDYVINGFESSVELSDKLAQYYTPKYANNPATYLLRSDKYEMHKILEKFGISHIKQNLYDVNKNNLAEFRTNKINYPCFVKPLFAASSTGANKINNFAELEKYFIHPEIFHNIRQNEQNQNKFLLAEYIEGQELFVDTFSINGEHYISTIQRYHKEQYNGRPMCYYFELERNEKIKQVVASYINKVLDVTEYRNGFAHTELFLLPNDEIKLIEINPRCSGAGGIPNKISLLSSGVDQVALLVKHVFKQELFNGDHKDYRCLILSNLSGKPLYNLQDNLKKYTTVYDIIQLVPDGHVIRSTDDVTVADASAFIILCADTAAKIEKDTWDIFAQDKTGWNKI